MCVSVGCCLFRTLRAFDPVFGWVRMGVGRCWWVFSLALDFINICKEKMSFEIIFLLLNVKC